MNFLRPTLVGLALCCPMCHPATGRLHALRLGLKIQKVNHASSITIHDANGRLIEDYWAQNWNEVEAHFRQMKMLGANVVRINSQDNPCRWRVSMRSCFIVGLL